MNYEGLTLRARYIRRNFRYQSHDTSTCRITSSVALARNYYDGDDQGKEDGKERGRWREDERIDLIE